MYMRGMSAIFPEPFRKKYSLNIAKDPNVKISGQSIVKKFFFQGQVYSIIEKLPMG